MSEVDRLVLLGTMVARIEVSLARIEAALIARAELDSLGHRIVYDTKTGYSENVPGCYCDPELLDGDGFQVRYR